MTTDAEGYVRCLAVAQPVGEPPERYLRRRADGLDAAERLNDLTGRPGVQAAGMQPLSDVRRSGSRGSGTRHTKGKYP